MAAAGADADVLPGRAADDPGRADRALNAKGEHELFARIGELFADRSVLVISHRFSTVRSVDPIYVLNEGYVVESGTHEKLLAAGGTYAELFTCKHPVP